MFIFEYSKALINSVLLYIAKYLKINSELDKNKILIDGNQRSKQT